VQGPGPRLQHRRFERALSPARAKIDRPLDNPSHVTRSPHLRSAARQPRGFRLGVLLLALWSTAGALGCGPQGATPMPEPPSIDGGRIGPGLLGVIALSEPHQVPIVGEPGAATPGATLRALNLDLDLPVVSATVAPDGSFSTAVLASTGNELRFQAVREGMRSTPADFLYTSAGGDQLTASQRFACLALSPGFELDLPVSGSARLRIENSCDGALTVATPRFRSGGRFTLDSSLPLEIPAGGEGTLDLRLASPGAEDVLFLDVAQGAQTLRYPVGLFSATE